MHLEVDESIPPEQMPPRRLPVAIKDRVKAELDRMREQGIMEQPSQCISALLVVQRANGKLRICIDPSKGLNKALKRPIYDAYDRRCAAASGERQNV